MDLDGQESANGTGEDRQVSNVVQFPRDWIGPTEELIPFGPRADRVALDGAADRVALDDPPDLPSASDFWGEHAAAMHSVLEDPSIERPPEQPAGADANAPRQHGRRSSLSRPRLAGGVVLAAAAAVAGAVLLLGHPTRLATPPADASAGFLASAALRLGSSEGIVGAVRHEQARAVVAMQRPHLARHAPSARHRVAAARTQAASPSPTTVVVHYRAPSTQATPTATNAATSTGGASTAGGTAVSSQSAGGTSSTASSGTSTSSRSSSSPSTQTGPVGAGAPFGPGHLG